MQPPKTHFLIFSCETKIIKITHSAVLEHTRYVLADEALWWFLIYVNILFSVCKGSQYNTTDIHSLSFNWNDSSCEKRQEGALFRNKKFMLDEMT